MFIIYKKVPHFVLETVYNCKIKGFKGNELSLLVNMETWEKIIVDITGDYSHMYEDDVLTHFVFLTQFAEKHCCSSGPYTKNYLHFRYKGSSRVVSELVKIKKDGMLCIDHGDDQMKLFKFDHCEFITTADSPYL